MRRRAGGGILALGLVWCSDFSMAPLARMEGRQAVLLDLDERKFTVGLGAVAHSFIRFVYHARLACSCLPDCRRLFCGYSCPPTVIPKFHWGGRLKAIARTLTLVGAARFAGSAKQRSMPLSASSLWTAFAVIAYFTSVTMLAALPLTFPAGSFLTFFSRASPAAGFCVASISTCALMPDSGVNVRSDTLIITYDHTR